MHAQVLAHVGVSRFGVVHTSSTVTHSSSHRLRRRCAHPFPHPLWITPVVHLITATSPLCCSGAADEPGTGRASTLKTNWRRWGDDGSQARQRVIRGNGRRDRQQ